MFQKGGTFTAFVFLYKGKVNPVFSPPNKVCRGIETVVEKQWLIVDHCFNKIEGYEQSIVENI